MAKAFKWKGRLPPGLSVHLGELGTRLLQAFPLSGEDSAVHTVLRKEVQNPGF